MGRKGGKPIGEFVQRLVEIGALVLTRQLECSDAAAREAMREIAHDICREYGGQQMYVPQDHEPELTQRDLDLWAAFDGHNHAELARVHDLSISQVHNVLRHVRRTQLALRQRQLPGLDIDASSTRPV